MINKDLITNIKYSILNGGLVQKVKLKDRFIIWGYNNFSEAKKRLLELNEFIPSPLHTIYKDPNLGYGIIITSDVIKCLRPEEVKKIQYFNYIYCDCIGEFNKDSKVYRFIDAKYVNQFFETGELMLSSFKRCENLENKERKDKEEGKNVLVGVGNGTIIAQAAVGIDCFMLCTSLSDNNVLPKGYTYKSAIEISHLDEVAEIIALKLQEIGYKIEHILYGKCIYGEKSISKDMDLTEIIRKVQDNKLDISEIYELLGKIGGPYMYFNKGSQFAHEKEVRFVWEVTTIPSEGMVVIKVPEIIPYCKRIDF